MASSVGYSVTKAAALHLMKSMAQSMGPKIRINAVLPGLLLTDWVNRSLNVCKQGIARLMGSHRELILGQRSLQISRRELS